jgi:hypothetical protein
MRILPYTDLWLLMLRSFSRRIHPPKEKPAVKPALLCSEVAMISMGR